MPPAAGSAPAARALARLLGTFHNISYYAPEMRAFADVGLPEYWRAYMAYRSAPLGQVPASVVAATFYNFAPRVVEAAIPSAWDSLTPAEAMALRDECIEAALRRSLGQVADPALLSEAADLVLGAIADCSAGARPLFAAHADLPTPDTTLMRLWFGCTLWREYRGDGHNIVLAAAGIDGIECHALLVARGVGNKATITKIRGWTDDEWDAAVARLAARSLLTPTGEATEQGNVLRRQIEIDTDRVAAAALARLGPANAERLVNLMEPLVQRLVESGSVAASWPPPRPPS